MTPLPHADPDDRLDRLTDLCLTARALIDEQGSPVMRRLIDLLLFELGAQTARAIEAVPSTPDIRPNRSSRAH